MVRPLLLPGVAALALALTACQGDLARKEQKAEAAVCAHLGAVATALEGVAALGPTSTVDDAQKAERSLATAMDQLDRSESRLEELRLKAFRNQLKTFRGEVQKVSRDGKLTLEQAGTTLKAKAQPLIQARRALSAAVKCEATATKP